jgi:phage-related protein
MTDYNININAKDNTGPAISKVSGGLGGLTAGAGKFKAALGIAGAAFAAMGAVSVIGDKINEFDDLAKSARAAGAAAGEEAFQGFQVMKQAMNEAGIDAGTFDRAMLNTSQRLQKGMEGAKGFGDIFDKLGDSVKTANGDLAAGPDLLKAMVNGLNEGTISTDEFAKVVGGRAGPLIQQQFASLNTSAEALEATLADVEANSNIVSLDAAQNAEVFNDNIGRLKEGMGQLMTDAITPLLPMLVKLSEDIMANMPAIIEGVSNALKVLQPVFSLLGTVLTDLVWPILSKVFEVLGTIASAIAPLVEQAIPALNSAFDGIVGIVTTVVEWFQKAAGAIQAIYDKAMALKDGVTGAFSSAGDKITGATDKMVGSVKSTWDNAYNYLVGNSVIPDLVDRAIQEFTRMDKDVVSLTENTTGKAMSAFDSLEKSIIDSLQGGKLAAGDFGGFFKDTMMGMVQDALNGGTQLQDIFSGISSIFGGGGGGGLFSSIGSLFGGGGGGGFLSSITSGISSFFGGFFANGGTLGAGKFGIAGEAGPEIITGPARVMSNQESFGGAAPAVNITIQAIDTQTGTEFLLKNKKQIEGIIQSAYNRRGKQGIY